MEIVWDYKSIIVGTFTQDLDLKFKCYLEPNFEGEESKCVLNGKMKQLHEGSKRDIKIRGHRTK